MNIIWVITIIMRMTLPPLLWHQVSFSVELPPLSFVRRTSWAVAVKKTTWWQKWGTSWAIVIVIAVEIMATVIMMTWWHDDMITWCLDDIMMTWWSCRLKTWCWASYQQCGPLSFPDNRALLLCKVFTIILMTVMTMIINDGNKNKNIDKYGDDDYIGLLGRDKAQADQDQGHQDLSKR